MKFMQRRTRRSTGSRRLSRFIRFLLFASFLVSAGGAAQYRFDDRSYNLYFAPSGARWNFSENGLTADENGQTIRYEVPFDLNQISADRTFNYPNYVAMFEDRRNRQRRRRRISGKQSFC
ncbi:MAG: hypothetical protein ACR2L1_07990 [Pyrinomonadaceae bacterium]